jgi:hypothetical protein
MRGFLIFFNTDDFLASTRDFLAIFPKKSPDFFSDFLRNNCFGEKIAIYRDFGDFC